VLIYFSDHMLQAGSYSKADPHSTPFPKDTTLGEFVDMGSNPNIIGNVLESPCLLPEVPKFVR
jgi:hypothetical protein